MEEEERLNGIESDKKAEVARLEEIYETRIRALGREIAVLKKKNEQLSVFAGKAASYDALKLRAEREIAELKRTYDKDITALRLQVLGLERAIADVEARMASEREAMREKLAAARGEYTSMKTLFDSEMRKYRAALNVSTQHQEWWRAEAKRVEEEALQKREALEQWHAKQMTSSLESQRVRSGAALEKALSYQRAASDAAMEAATAQALGERNALQALMEERLEEAENKREAEVKASVRAAVAEAETRVAGEWRAAVDKAEARNANVAKLLTQEHERRLEEAKNASEAELEGDSLLYEPALRTLGTAGVMGVWVTAVMSGYVAVSSPARSISRLIAPVAESVFPKPGESTPTKQIINRTGVPKTSPKTPKTPARVGSRARYAKIRARLDALPASVSPALDSSAAAREVASIARALERVEEEETSRASKAERARDGRDDADARNAVERS